MKTKNPIYGETDIEFVKRIRLIPDPVEMLRALVENEYFLGRDSYYQTLREAMLTRAEEIVNKVDSNDRRNQN